MNTRFSCLATLDDEHSFVPIWRPSFVSELSAEDRCHLNGVAIVEGEPAYVSVLGISNEANGWRENKALGGALLDVKSSQVVSGGLSRPHSPRWHDGQLWLLESPKGAVSIVDCASGQVEEVARVPGFARGLSFYGHYAFVGLSRVREHMFDGLPLTNNRTEHLECGVWVIDTRSGESIGCLMFDGLVQEVFEVVVLNNLRFPELVEPRAPLLDSAFAVP